MKQLQAQRLLAGAASGATSLRLCALWTMPLAWLSTISTRISTATPAMARSITRTFKNSAMPPTSVRAPVALFALDFNGGASAECAALLRLALAVARLPGALAPDEGALSAALGAGGAEHGLGLELTHLEGQGQAREHALGGA